MSTPAPSPSSSPPTPDPNSLPPILGWSGLTDVGRFRPNNEDVFLALNFDGHEVRYLGKTGQASLSGSDFVFAVSDGMGGAKSGEFASRFTVDRITRLLPRHFRLSAAGMKGGFQDTLTELFSAIHLDLMKLGASYEECAGMGCTLSLCWFTPEWAYFGHIGDSRIYYLPAEGGMNQLSQDHSFVGTQRRKGLMNEREARSDPRRSALQQALGSGNQFIDPQIGAVGHRVGDRFVICSDGLVDGLWDRELEELARSAPLASPADSLAQRLVSTAVQNSGRDNTTAIVIEILPAVS
ncbi:MAG: protein phosphatase 2C domain-containing protein [Opitutus sp.]